jgi:Tfp pilus assembly protein PilO
MDAAPTNAATAKKTASVWRERLASPLTWHIVGFAVLLVVTIVLGVRFGLDWAATSSSSVDALVTKQFQLKALDMQTSPLRGLDKKVAESHKDIAQFYADRIPPNYSSIDKRVGELQVASGVHLTRMQYTQGKPDADLTKISLDCNITGEYTQIMHFVNTLERDKTFFLIEGMSLTGQQGGMVSLRLEVATWLRPADAAASGLPPTPEGAAKDNSASTGTGAAPAGTAGPGSAVPGKDGE